jgi:hypothetical protein
MKVDDSFPSNLKVCAIDDSKVRLCVDVYALLLKVFVLEIDRGAHMLMCVFVYLTSFSLS